MRHQIAVMRHSIIRQADVDHARRAVIRRDGERVVRRDVFQNPVGGIDARKLARVDPGETERPDEREDRHAEEQRDRRRARDARRPVRTRMGDAIRTGLASERS